MGRKATEKGAVQVARLVKPGLHFVGGVDGLALQVVPSGGRSWILRMTVGGRRRDMGLGGFPDVPLSHAREAARKARAMVRDGIDPIDEGRAKASRLKAMQSTAVTFEQCAAEYIKGLEPSWKSTKSASQWRNSLGTYAYPVLGKLLVRDVGVPQVLAVLRPIWATKTETASRVRGRMEAVLDFAAVSEYREAGLNPARWRGHLDKILPAPGQVSETEHHKAISFMDIAEFMPKLRSVQGVGARVLEFTILTAVRSGEARGTTWSEIDLGSALWTIPAERMKGPRGSNKREHRVPLSKRAIALLKAQPRMANNDLVFPAPREGTISDGTMSAVLRRMGVAAVPHGFRSTFRDWAAECTDFPNELCELALAHAVGDKVEAAYRRGDMYMKRVRMMEAWAKFCDTPYAKSEVIPIGKAKKG